ncbi:unnamed protein product, partial [Pelagomonas calceolata]
MRPTCEARRPRKNAMHMRRGRWWWCGDRGVIPARAVVLPVLGRDIRQDRPAARHARLFVRVVRLVVAVWPGAESQLRRRLPLRASRRSRRRIRNWPSRCRRGPRTRAPGATCSA